MNKNKALGEATLALYPTDYFLVRAYEHIVLQNKNITDMIFYKL